MSGMAIILAAGEGKRMKSDRPQVLHEAAGAPLLAWVGRAARASGVERVVAVIGNGADRVRDTPLSEAAIIGTCVGAAMVGMKPVAEIMFADFLGECFDQIVNNAAKMHYMFDGQFTAPIVVRTATGGGFGGGPHHSQSVEGWFLNVPGLVIVGPTTPADAKGLMISSIEDDNPVLFLEHKGLYRTKGEVPEGMYRTPLRSAAIARGGSDGTILAAMRMVNISL